jgi:hypothetical protein
MDSWIQYIKVCFMDLFFKQVFLASILYHAYAQQYLPKLN